MNNKEEIKPKENVEKVLPPKVEKKEELNNIVGSEEGINLIPILTKEEVKKEDNKKRLNIGAISSLIVLFLISILVVGFNIVFKIRLNAEKSKLQNRESQIEAYTQKIVNNNEILDRVFLYNDIQKGRYSSKEVIQYVDSVVKKANCSLMAMGFSGNNTMEFSGKASNLEDLSKLWYLLANDPKIESITLKSVGKGTQEVNFAFNGNFVLDNFLMLGKK